MDILVSRDELNADCTTGRMFVNGMFECFTLEPTFRTGPKVPGHTAIPEGVYEVTTYNSPHFGHVVPLLKNVPNFEDVEIHSGNTANDTKACILVGQSRAHNSVLSSHLAFAALLPKISGALAKGDKVILTVVNQPEEE